MGGNITNKSIETSREGNSNAQDHTHTHTHSLSLRLSFFLSLTLTLPLSLAPCPGGAGRAEPGAGQKRLVHWQSALPGKTREDFRGGTIRTACKKAREREREREEKKRGASFQK